MVNRYKKSIKCSIVFKYCLLVLMMISTLTMCFTLIQSGIWAILGKEQVNILGFASLGGFVVTLLGLLLQEQFLPMRKLAIKNRLNVLTEIILDELNKEQKSLIYLAELCDLYAKVLGQMEFGLKMGSIFADENIINILDKVRKMFSLGIWKLAESYPDKLIALLMQIKEFNATKDIDALKKS